MERHRRAIVLTVVLATLSIAAGPPVALRVETAAVRPEGDATVISVTVQVAPEDRPRLGRDVWVQGELLRRGQRVNRVARAVDLDERGQAAFEVAWPPGDYELRVSVEGASGKAAGIWVGPLAVPALTSAAGPVAAAPAVAIAAVAPPPTVAATAVEPSEAVPTPQPEAAAPTETAPEPAAAPTPPEALPVAVAATAAAAAVVPRATAAVPEAQATAAKPAPQPEVAAPETAPEPAVGPTSPEALPVPVAATAAAAAAPVAAATQPTEVAPEPAAEPLPAETPPVTAPEATVVAVPVAAPRPAAVEAAPEPAIPAPVESTPEPASAPAPVAAVPAAPASAAGSWAAAHPALADVTVIVTERNRPILGLGPTAFQLRVGGSPVTVDAVGDAATAPLNLAIVADLAPDSVDLADEIARQLGRFSLRTRDGGDLLVATTVDPQPSWGGGADGITRWADATAAGRPDDLAALVTAAAQSFAGRRGRTFLLVVTDGSDASGKAAWRDASAAAETAGVPVFVIGLRDNGFDDQARSALNRVAEVTGGRSYFLGTASMTGMTLDYLGELMDASLALAFRPPASGQSPREVKVEVVNRDWQVHYPRRIP